MVNRNSYSKTDPDGSGRSNGYARHKAAMDARQENHLIKAKATGE